ncbi:MAG: sugar nucleotide-binding protein [Flavobacteriaceae bacterium]|jgi:dTDP-4-dehydrorhamnose reductase|nr:sugar nucleotide-binding protein [Flavobacteriaceae bacterium]
MKRVLFYGGASLLSNIWSRYWKEDHIVYLGLHKKWIEIDGTTSIQISDNLEDLENVIKNNKIDIIINCAGLTNVEECEKKSEKAYFLNGYLPGEIARITSKLKVKLIHISTDHLFSGGKEKEEEASPIKPLNIYAKSKSIGDQEVQKYDDSALIIRTNFFGLGPIYKPSFSDKIISSLKNNQKIYLFSDVFYTPIHVHTLANYILELVNINSKGIFNVCSNNRISKFDFGIMIAERMNKDKNLIVPIKIETKTDLTIRPKDMSLSNKKLKKLINRDIEPLQDQIKLL